MNENANKDKDKDNTNESTNEWKAREMGALWRREGKQQNFLSGLIKTGADEFGVKTEVKVVVFTNKGKSKNERAPDFIIYEDRPREEAESTLPDPEAKPEKDENDEVPVGF